jgi:hypothetical protein
MTTPSGRPSGFWRAGAWPPGRESACTPGTRTNWINAAKAERLQAEATICSSGAPARLSRQEIKTVVEYFADLAAVVRDADPADKAEIYRGLNLVLTYQPAAQTVRAQAHLAGDPHGVMVRVRGGT